MKKRKIETIVLVTETRVIRADRHGPEDGVSVIDRPRHAEHGLADSIRTVFTDRRTKGGVVVLSTDVWIQTLSLGREQVAGLAPADLARALAFEAETFSGIPARQSALGYRGGDALDGSAAYWIAQVTRSDLESVKAAVAEAGGTLYGLGHPGGLPLPMAATNGNEPWQRVEIWDGAYVLVSNADGQRVRTRILNAIPGADVLTEIDEDPEWLDARGGDVPLPGPGVRFELAVEESRRRWCEIALEVLAADPLRLPLAQSETAPGRRSPAFSAGFALTALVMLGTVAWYGFLTWQRIGLTATEAGLVTATAALEAARREESALADELKANRLAAESAKEVGALRASLAILLAEIGRRRPADVVILTMKQESNGMICGGVSLDARLVDEFGAELSAALQPSGWAVRTREVRAREAGIWDFSLAFQHRAFARPAAVPETMSN